MVREYGKDVSTEEQFKNVLVCDRETPTGVVTDIHFWNAE